MRVLGISLVVCALGAGCQARRGASAEPTARTSADPGHDDLGHLFEDETIRSHSPQAGTYAELSEGCPYAPDEVPSIDALADPAIPEFNRRRARRTNMHRGHERIHDIDLHAHMLGMQGQIFECVDVAACYDDGTALRGDGDLLFDFELLPSGKVAAVSVQASEGLDHPSVVACARQTMYEYRFPKYDGGQMMVEYVMTIEEVPDDA